MSGGGIVPVRVRPPRGFPGPDKWRFGSELLAVVPALAVFEWIWPVVLPVHARGPPALPYRRVLALLPDPVRGRAIR
ncbi:MAG: hypothetical protein MPK62_02390 [Alphaproteobacteria bacterium]|nr:hypothetical protein [Alphaproteobacteria bacterium]